MPTGIPSTFICSRCRLRPCTKTHHDGVRLRITRCSHQSVRTGRTKKNYGKKAGSLRTRHEYTCECGHTGWSCIPAVLKIPLAS